MSPLSQSLPTEHARQVFTSSDTNNDGSVSALEFVNIMMKIRNHAQSCTYANIIIDIYIYIEREIYSYRMCW